MTLPCHIEGVYDDGSIAEFWRRHYFTLFFYIRVSRVKCFTDAGSINTNEVQQSICQLKEGKTGLNLITAAPKIFNPKKFCCYVNCLVCVLLCVVFVCFVLMDPESGNKAERIQKSPSEI